MVGFACLTVNCCNKSHGTITSLDVFKPDAQYSSRQILDISGTDFPVTVQSEMDRGRLRLTVNQGDSTLDREEYEVSPAGFFLFEAADTTYSPPLPLIQFPMTPGDKWSWRGLTTSFGKDQPTFAQITTQQDPLLVGKSVHNTVRIDVKVTLERSVKGAQVSRTLIFWFGPGEGLLQRDFSGVSIRKPSPR